jgi:hypothetical protein
MLYHSSKRFNVDVVERQLIYDLPDRRVTFVPVMCGLLGIESEETEGGGHANAY